MIYHTVKISNNYSSLRFDRNCHILLVGIYTESFSIRILNNKLLSFSTKSVLNCEHVFRFKQSIGASIRYRDRNKTGVPSVTQIHKSLLINIYNLGQIIEQV
uniref:Uncharacterized protein n=1 Tax=Octopus bimaculoides TaxID=37653 RepID=A0A0L8HL30_OCTBM